MYNINTLDPLLDRSTCVVLVASVALIDRSMEALQMKAFKAFESGNSTAPISIDDYMRLALDHRYYKIQLLTVP